MTPSGKIGEEGSDDSTLRGPERAKENLQGGAQVFEVTNLVIPSGTDLSFSAQVLGTLMMDPFIVQGFGYFYLEIAEPLPVDSPVFGLAMFEDPEDPVNTDDAGVDLAPDSAVRGFYRLPDQPNGFLFGGQATPSGPYNPVELSIGLYTRGDAPAVSGATTADITVVRARASFMVI